MFDLNAIIRPNIKRMKPYSSARDEFKDFQVDMIFLDANENPFENGVNRYPDPQQKTVKSVLAELKSVEEDQILLGNGSDEVLDLIFRAFCNPGIDNVITLPPTYGMYSVLADTNAIENRKVLLNSAFQPAVEAILASADTNSKLLFLCSPNNPTGNSFNKEAVETILKNFSGIVVIDEAYIDFSENDSWLSSLDQYPNLIVTQTLSKAYGMAGIRLGICYASSEIIAILNKIKPPYNVNQLTQQKALSRLQKREEINKEVLEIKASKIHLIKCLKRIDFVSEIFDSDANFVLVRVDNATKRYNQLIKNNIVIRNRTTQPLCENCLRFTVGTPDENNALIEALKTL